ncbi:MAG: lactonase family protein [Victivallaceae bacterium]
MRILIMAASLLAMQTATEAKTLDIYVGTYTQKSSSKGIYHSELDLTTGAMSGPELAAATPNPSFIEINPDGTRLYAVGEGKTGTVSAFSIDRKTKKLTLLNKVDSGGSSPCYLCLDRSGKFLLVANYGGSVAVLPVNSDGSLAAAACVIKHQGSSVNPKRQKEAHVHSVNVSPDNRFVFVADLGMDKILIYQLNEKTGQLEKNIPAYAQLTPGSGPRHFTFHPNGKFAYVINELNETVIAFSYNAINGELKEIQTISTLPADFKGISWCAEVKVHPNGQFLYGSNRGHDSLAVFKIDQEKGTLTAIGYQKAGIKNPRHFNLDPSGTFCLTANQDGDSICSFRVNQQSGMPEPAALPIAIGKPVCVKFLP